MVSRNLKMRMQANTLSMTIAGFLCLLLCSTEAWTLSSPIFTTRRSISGTSGAAGGVVLYNIPPPAEDNLAAFTDYCSKLPPPASFFELQRDCIRATRLARKDGHTLLEVEYPPLPANVLEMDDVSAYEVSRANLNLALDYAKGLLADSTATSIAILLPDPAETDFAVEFLGGTATPAPGLQIASLRRPASSSSGDKSDSMFQPEQFLLNLFQRGGAAGVVMEAIQGVDLYICLTASAQELPDIEQLAHAIDDNAAIVCFNLKLDILRGDLGAPAFPSKDFQDRFLSKVKPVYYLRTRQYSRSTAQPPFLVNYQGCLFRAYPGHYQTLLDTGNGRYRRLCGSPVRPALGEFKQQLTNALQEQGVLISENPTLSFLRTGYKTTTWWEEERPNSSDAWKT